MWTLSGFSDEISDDFTEQCEVAGSLGLTHLELRSAWGTNILDLDQGQLDAMRTSLDLHGLRVSSIGSPIGKIPIEEDFGPHRERMRHAAEVAHFFEAPYIRIFSFFMPPGADPTAHRDEVLARMRALAEIAEETNVVLLHENEKEIYGDTPERCLDVVESVGSPKLRVAWDSANFVQVGVRPFTAAYALLRPHLEYVQVKDAKAADGTVTPAGEGDGELVETVRALRDDGFDGFFSLEPHLSDVGALGGFSGPELFATAYRAFTGLLHAEGIEYV
jgi:sugar phosphate isomerase/epimerase